MIPDWLPLAIVLLPAAGAVLTACLPWRRAALAHAIAAALLGGSGALAVWMATLAVRAGTAWQGPHATWLDAGPFELGVGVFVDPMGACMAAIVCVLATAVIVFNTWYMDGDRLAARFPWQFCLFVTAMLGVVLADNLFLSFCCWELVGLGSYLLIGFWFDKPLQDTAGGRTSPAHAQSKAFVMNRIGDAGFLLGIGALLAVMVNAGQRGSVLDFVRLGEAATAAHSVAFLGVSGHALLVLAALGIFAGAIGKSAQFPLHGWLPDAMQGPTTASSIIHAATMVAAGVFLVARCYPLFPPEALAVVGWTGGITCLFAATAACVQSDLKAVLAWSTISQLGLMFAGLGAGEAAGGRAAAVAHLFTHALFKCLLFLCAGVVIHAAHGCQDLHRLGGLRRRMPATAWCALAAVLAIAGAPLFSGFVSKDAVLAATWAHAASTGGAAWGPVLLIAAGSLLTAAYMLRWWLSIFAGDERDHVLVHHAHDPATDARTVLLLLAPCTLALPWTAGGWLDHALRAPHGDALHTAHRNATVLAGSLLVVGASFALFVFWWAPRRGIDVAQALQRRLAPIHAACARALGVDRLWHVVFARGVGRRLAALCARADLGSPSRVRALDVPKDARAARIDSLDGLVDGIGRLCARLGRTGAALHAGRLSVYLLFAAVVGLAGLGWRLWS